jgi:hypothetical protein
VSGAPLTWRQECFLIALLDGPQYPGRVFHLAFPEAEHKGRRDAGARRTLEALERLGYVSGCYPYLEATARRWSLTEAGREKALVLKQERSEAW